MADCRRCKSALPDAAVFCPACGAKQEVIHSRRTRGNGTGTVYKRPSGKWQAEVTLAWDKAEKRRLPRTKGGFATKKEALAYLPILAHRENRKRVTLNDHYQAWEAGSLPNLSKSKQTAYKIAWGKLAEIAFRDMGLIKIGDLQDVVDRKGTSYYTKRDMKVLLSHLYTRAAAQQDVATNLASFIELPPLEEDEPTPFTGDEQKLLWKDYAEGNIFTGYILLMIYSGMMPGELIKATKDMIKWDRQVIEGAGIKTKERKKTPLIIADIIVPVLTALCRYSDTDALLSMKRNDFYDAFDATLRRCGCRDLTPYACRHTTATALSLNDIAPSVIQKVMRHAKFATTQRYIHIDTAPMLAALNKTLGQFNSTTDQLHTEESGMQ